MIIIRNIRVIIGTHPGQVSFSTAIVSPGLMKAIEVSPGVVYHGCRFLALGPFRMGERRN
jgi:hypothetical protein